MAQRPGRHFVEPSSIASLSTSWKGIRIASRSRRQETTTAGPPSAWSWFSNSPLVGCGLQRESLRIHAWDDAHAVYLLDIHGRLLTQRRSPKPLFAVAAADTGKRIAALGKQGQVWWLDEQLRPMAEVLTNLEPLALAVDPHGDYAAVAGSGSRLFVVSWTGEILADVVVSQTMNHLAFVPATGRILGAAEQGMIASHDLRGNLIWKETMFSTVGGMAVDGSGDAILLACYGHGVLRFDSTGRREGTYQVERSPHVVAIDFDAAHILAGAIDGHVVALNFEGQVLADRSVGDKPVSLSMDALGRFVVLGFPTGEVRLASWDELSSTPSPARVDSKVAEENLSSQVTPTVVGAAWTVPIAKDWQEAASAVIEPIPNTGDVGVFSSQRSLRIFDANGSLCHESDRLEGTGRTLWPARDWLIAATDRRILAYDRPRNQSIQATRSVYEVSHIAPLGQFGEMLVVESCDQITRLRLPDEALWKQRLPVRLAQFAAHADGRSAMVLEDRQLAVFDSAGKLAGRFRSPRQASMLLVDRSGGWITASLDECLLRGHDEVGREQWSQPLPWDPWSLRRFGKLIVVTSANGRSLLANDSGRILETSEEAREGAVYLLLADGRPARMYLAGQTFLVTSFDGRLLWRRAVEGPIGAIAANSLGLWVMVDRWLTHFPFHDLPKTGG